VVTEGQRFQKTSYIIEVPSGTERGEYPLSVQDIAPCHLACPVGIDVKKYVTAIAEEEFEKALSIIRDDNCLPAAEGCARIPARGNARGLITAGQ
jgi:NADPH-dependent glutamate synthase beta subunit-like oxidoreductase